MSTNNTYNNNTYINNNNNTHNTNTYNQQQTTNYQLILQSITYKSHIILITTFTFVVITNTMLIFGFYKTSKKPHAQQQRPHLSTTTKLFIYLSIIEMALVGVMVPTMFTLNKQGVHVAFNVTAYTAMYLLSFIELVTLSTISFLRFVSIFKPLCRVESRYIVRALVLEFCLCFVLVSALFSTVILLDFTIDEVLRFNSKIAAGLQFCSILFNLTLNVLSSVILRRRSISTAVPGAKQESFHNISEPQQQQHQLHSIEKLKQQQEQQQHDKLTNNNSLDTNKTTSRFHVDKRRHKTEEALNTLIIITAIQFVCYSLFTVIDFIPYKIIISRNLILLKLIFQCIQLSNAGFNSVILMLRTKKLRQFYGIKKCCTSDSPEEHAVIENIHSVQMETEMK